MRMVRALSCTHSSVDGTDASTAVLRKVAQLQEAGAWQQPLVLDAHGSLPDQLSLYHSHPSWMVQRWLEQFGQDETVELLHANNR